MPDGQSANPASRIAMALRLGMPLADHEFDALLPHELRRVSSRFWTPICVLRFVIDWLREEGVGRIVDVGSGPGKFCVAGALASDLQFVGIEHRESLCEAARDLARRAGATERTTFLHRRASAADVASSDAVYLFNPFGENLFDGADWLDDAVELGEERFRTDVGIVERGLTEMRVGGLVFTYHGFGGRIPGSFRAIRQAFVRSDVVRMWKKVAPVEDGSFWLELDRGRVHRVSPP